MGGSFKIKRQTSAIGYAFWGSGVQRSRTSRLSGYCSREPQKSPTAENRPLAHNCRTVTLWTILLAGMLPEVSRTVADGKTGSDPTISCMLVGDGAVGKTSMIISYIANGYPDEYRQTAFDVFTGKLLRLG